MAKATDEGNVPAKAFITAALSELPQAVALLQMGSLGNNASFQLLFSSAALHELVGRDLAPHYAMAISSAEPELFPEVLLDYCKEALLTQKIIEPKLVALGNTCSVPYCTRIVPMSTDVVRLHMEAGTSAQPGIKVATRLEQGFGLLLEATPDAMIIADAQGTIQLVNTQAERIFGYSRAEMLGRSVEMLMPSAVRRKHGDHVKRYTRDPELRMMGDGRELVATRKDGSEFQVEIALSPVNVEGSMFTFAAVRDITERRSAQEAKRQLEAILKSSQDAIVTNDLEGRITSWNPGAQQMFGYSEEDVLGKSIALLIPSDKRLMEHAAEKTVLDHGEIQQFESLRLHRDGTSIDVAITVSPIRNEYGTIIGLSDMAKSIESRKNAERDLHELNRTLEERIVERSNALIASEERYSDTLDKMMEGVQFIDTAYRYVYVNDALVAQSTYTREELLGRTMTEMFPGMAHTAFFSTLQECMADRTARTMDNDFIFPDGSRGYFQLSIQPMDSGIFILSSDITERMRSEDALRASEARYHNALDGLSEGAQVVGYDWRPLYVNDALAALTNSTKEELLSATIMERYPGVEQTENFKHMQRCMVDRSSHSMETDFTFRNGITKSLYVRVQPAAEGLFILTEDITQRKRNEMALAVQRQKLKEQNYELEQFTYIASHDLQEPLRMVTSYVQLLQRRYGEKLGTEGNEFIHFAVDGAQRMKQLIDDLLIFSRVGQPTKLQTVDMNMIVKDAIANLAKAMSESGVKLHVEELPRVRASPSDMLQVMQNLIGNALKFHRPDTMPEVWVKGREEGTYCYFEVVDNGIGIEPAYRDRIFAPFNRLHARTAYAGSGIGLAIVKKIVERYGGRIQIASVQGEGSTFQFTIEHKRT